MSNNKKEPRLNPEEYFFKVRNNTFFMIMWIVTAAVFGASPLFVLLGVPGLFIQLKELPSAWENYKRWRDFHNGVEEMEQKLEYLDEEEINRCCPYCGEIITRDNVFCPRCGESLYTDT